MLGNVARRGGVVAGWSLFALLSTGVAQAGSGPILIVNPLPVPFFSIDRASPTADGMPIGADDILDKPGPNVQVSGFNLGLGVPGPGGDELDELSGFHSSLAPATSFALLFSVDRGSTGLVPPEPALVGMNRPYNVQHQALRHQAAGDLYMSTRLFTLAGPLAGAEGPGNNTLVRNQGDAGGGDFDLHTDDSPDTFVPPSEDIDDLDAVAEKESPLTLGATPSRIFFTVDRESPSLLAPQLPGPDSGATIFLDTNLLSPTGQNVYATPAMLGLQVGDDVDGLIVIDDGDGVFETGLDFIIFSLDRMSPTLALQGVGPADLFISNGNMTQVLAVAQHLGLSPEDNIDALELLVTGDITAAILNHALFPEPATLTLLAAGLVAIRRRRGAP